MKLTLENIEPITLRIITAFAASQKKNLSTLVYKKGIEGVLLEALQNESASIVQSGTVPDDIKTIVTAEWQAVWMGLSANHNAKKAPPESIAISLEAKAAALTPEAPATTPSVA